MESSTTADAKKVIEQITKGLRSGEVSAAVRKAAGKYARLCGEANKRLHRCVSLLQQDSEQEYAVLMQAMRSPDLRDLATLLSAPTLTGWRDFCRQHGLAAAEPIDDKALAKLSSLYARIGGKGGKNVEAATGETGGKTSPAAAPDIDRPGGRETAAKPVVATTSGGGHASGPAIVTGGASPRTHGQQRKRQGAGGKLLLVCGLLLLFTAAAVIALLPGLRERSDLARLSTELDGLFEQGNWEQAGVLIETHRDRLSKYGSRPPLSESLAVWNLAAELRDVGANVHRYPGYQGFESAELALEEIDRKGDENGVAIDRHPGLAELLERNQTQLNDWSAFLASVDEAWAALARLEPNPLAEQDETAELLAGFAPDPAQHAQQLLSRIERVAEQVQSFDSLRQRAADSTPEQDDDLRRQSGELSARILAMADGADSKVSGIVVAMAAEIDRFEPHSARLQAPPVVATAPPAMPVQEPPSGPTETDSPPVPSRPVERPQSKPAGNQPPVVSTERKPRPPSQVAFALPPTFLVMWNRTQTYRVDPGSSGIDFFDAKVTAFGRDPSALGGAPRPGAASWVAIVGEGIRETLNGSPIFTRSRDGDAMILQGRAATGYDSTFLIRFAADRGEAAADFQVLVYRPPEQNYMFRQKAAGQVVRVSGQPQSLQLAPALAAAVRPMHLVDKGLQGRLLLRLETRSGEVRGEPVEIKHGALPLAQLRLSLAGAGGAVDKLKQVEEQLKQVTTMKEAKAAFEVGVAQCGGTDQLFRDMKRYEVERSSSSFSSRATLSVSPVAESLLPIANLTLFVSDRGSSGVRPPLVDYVQYLATHLLEADGKLLDLGGTNSADRGMLASLQRIRVLGGWRKKSDFQALRKQWAAVTEYAGKRSKLEPGYQPGVTPSQRDDESVDKYIDRLNALQLRVNTDLLFSNWARLFADDEVDRFWPWLVDGGKTTDLDSRLKALDDQRASLNQQAEVTKKLQDSSLESLGNYFVDCEIVTDGQPAQVIRLIQLEGTAPAASVSGDVSAIAQK